ncbi:MAG: lytic transglycosylase domain-containing protein [Rickettsiaceae bacterium]|nr:lytic transglycosylase domain-containing protein [Rickettsiaceae bacterium]MDP5021284.1 lytic transglycosylase domain-containing protein [Rickettsiaceae bacterium]MDP5082955.1 lytic transglycosylase domain-containing protein [Rickettsiaceae bacterium]
MNKLCYLFFLLLASVSFSAFAGIDPELLESKKCSNMFAYFEARYKLPQHTLHSISLQETQKAHSTHKIALVWPWTINANGKGYHFETKDKALAFARAQIAAGNKSIDVGCMQINLKYHPDAFASLEQAFSPRNNIAYGAKFLKDHYNKAGSWNKAIGRYHSGEQSKAARYQASVSKLSDEMLSYKQKLKNIAYNNQHQSKTATKKIKATSNTNRRDINVQVNVGTIQDNNWFRKVH